MTFRQFEILIDSVMDITALVLIFLIFLERDK